MIFSNSQRAQAPTPTPVDIPAVSESDHPGVFADIFQDSRNIAIWQRELSPDLRHDVEALLGAGKTAQIELTVAPNDCAAQLRDALQISDPRHALIEDMAGLVDLFCQLFDQGQAKLRLTTLDRVMCPRFHIDRVPCRLVTTYIGCSTQWLPHEVVDHSKLGRGNNGLPDERSGVYRSAADIRQLNSGDVALLKGSQWQGSQLSGLVHRSPAPEPGELRLLFTLDFVL